MSCRILVVEDDSSVALVVRELLQAEGYTVEVAGDGKSGLRMAVEGQFDLVVLDLRLPGLNGLDICQTIRERGFEVAILMLTAKGRVEDRVEGLRRGADDYLVKPFSPVELIAKAEALLRRTHKLGQTPVLSYQFGNVAADFLRLKLRKNGTLVSLTAKEWELLRFWSTIEDKCSLAKASWLRFGPRGASPPAGQWTFISPGCVTSWKMIPNRPGTSSR